jgi:hypothetical protein
MIQEIFAPGAGYISAIIWMDFDDHGESAFAFGASDGNIQIYERSNDVSATGVACWVLLTMFASGVI